MTLFTALEGDPEVGVTRAFKSAQAILIATTPPASVISQNAAHKSSLILRLSGREKGATPVGG